MLGALNPCSNFQLSTTPTRLSIPKYWHVHTFGLVDAVSLHERIRHAAQGVYNILVGQVALPQLASPLRAQVGALPRPDERLLM